MFPRSLLLVLVLLLDLVVASNQPPDRTTKASGENDGITRSSPSGEGTDFCTGTDCPEGRTEVGEETPEYRQGHGQPFGSHRQPAGEVEVLPYMISPQDFHQHFVTKHRPLLFKGGVKHWPAYTLWDEEYLKLHMGMEQDKDLHPDMKKDVILPTCLRCEEMYSQSFTTQLHTGSGEASSRLHIDTQENLFAVLRGPQTVLLVSPLHSNNVYADEARVLGVSPVDVDFVDMEKYPRVADVQYQRADLEAGDLLYVPQMWWRHVRADSGRQQGVVIRWRSKPADKQTQQQNSQAQQQNSQVQEQTVPERRYSYGQWLAAYELWVQNVSSSSPRLTCHHQNSPMSVYNFETMKQDLDIFNGPELDGDGCLFDDQNPKCPCHYDPCLEDDADPQCIRYVLDYCLYFEDRGCITELPQLLNKLYKTDFEKLSQTKSDYVP
ncbi:hypothetical protein Bbelb_353430 [Branchiostoma belcheri]|nr:hypothetical protein Bbelb_353430 [Branchiostoma belcheri]